MYVAIKMAVTRAPKESKLKKVNNTLRDIIAVGTSLAVVASGAAIGYNYYDTHYGPTFQANIKKAAKKVEADKYFEENAVNLKPTQLEYDVGKKVNREKIRNRYESNQIDINAYRAPATTSVEISRPEFIPGHFELEIKDALRLSGPKHSYDFKQSLPVEPLRHGPSNYRVPEIEMGKYYSNLMTASMLPNTGKRPGEYMVSGRYSRQRG